MTPRKTVHLIAGGRYHDIDFARLELLRFLAEHEHLRVTAAADYADTDAIDAADIVVTYTCGIIPNTGQIAALHAFLARGGRWFALHGTNSLLHLDGDKSVVCPPLPPAFRAMLGSQFMAHPAPGRIKVKNAAPDHPLVAGIETFFVEDENYLQDHDSGNIVLLETRFSGRTSLFERADWPDGTHQVMYLRDHAPGAVLYLTLGHARGRYDMRPLSETYPFVERGSWGHPVFDTLLRRGILWAARMGDFG
jgi:type 1 glutamine amidotransferase